MIAKQPPFPGATLELHICANNGMLRAVDRREDRRPMQDLLVERAQARIEITLHRPDRGNAIREWTAAELLQVLAEAEADRSIRTVLIAGGEKSFCTGVDTSEQKHDPDEVFEHWRRRKRSRKVNELFRTLPVFTKPVIAAVEGYAFGGGFELALLCDFIVAGEAAQFALTEAKLGLMPGGFGTQTLPRIVGKPLAKELMWTGRRLSAAEAQALRIVNHVTVKGEALARARALADAIAANAPLSVMFTKQAIERGMDVSLAEGMNVESDAFFALAFSADRNEGLAAFRDKRAAQFTGK